jgi:hypothetical protein
MAHPFLQACGLVAQALLDDGAPVPTVLTGDADAFIEINETWNLTIPLTNVGGLGATAISAVLSSSTPGITFPSSASAYPDLAVSASGNNTTPYAFKVGAARPAATRSTSCSPSPTPARQPAGIQLLAPDGRSRAGAVVLLHGSGGADSDAGDLSGTLPGAPAVAPIAVAGVLGNIFSVTASIDGAPATRPSARPRSASTTRS